MHPVKVKGRGALVGLVRYADGQAVIRLDDSRNDEFWAEIRLTPEQLKEMESQARESADPADDDLPKLADLRGSMPGLAGGKTAAEFVRGLRDNDH